MTSQIIEGIERRNRPQRIVIRDESVKPAEYEDAINIMLERKDCYGQMPLEDDFSPEEAQKIISGLGQSTFAGAVIETLREVRRRNGQEVDITQSSGDFTRDPLPPRKGVVIESDTYDHRRVIHTTAMQE